MKIFNYIFTLSCVFSLSMCCNAAVTLHDVVQLGDIASVQLLLDSGTDVDVNVKDADGATVLHIACAMGNKEMAKYLLDKGADVNAKDNEQSTPLHKACFHGINEIVTLLH